MPTYVTFLRAINVGGTGKLPMAELRALCQDLGLERVATYIQSGNVIFHSRLGEARLQKALERALEEKMGKPVGVFLRTREELEHVVRRNPFKAAPPNRLMVLFLDAPPPKGALAGLEAPGGEQLATSGREIFIHFPQGMGQSKLKVPFAKTSTARNLNTVQKVLALAAEVEAGG